MESKIVTLLEKNSIDIELSEKILQTINSPAFLETKMIKAAGIPSFESRDFSIYDFSGKINWRGDLKKAAGNISDITDSVILEKIGSVSGSEIYLDNDNLELLGLYLLPYVSIGILNGGSATSYADYQKNSSFNPALFVKCEKLFNDLCGNYKEKPKGIVPAYINADLSSGASFLELKMRNMLLKIKKYQETINSVKIENPFFQMTSISNNSAIESEYRIYRNSKWISNLIDKTGVDVTSMLTGIQPLIAAFTHSEEGMPRNIFTRAFGKDNSLLPLPGGHGQNFMILKDIYKTLYQAGKRFVYLGNVDNLGFNIDLKELAVLALSGSQAGFDFSYKTQVDVKGGILVYDEKGKINCADIGSAIPACDVEEAEKQGKSILFNCATGLFNLKYLVGNIDSIIDKLPLRLSDQDKDAGKYSQAEQTTWEVIGLLDNAAVFAVDKYNRFLASKILMENLLISRPECCKEFFRQNPDNPMNAVSGKMNNGLENILENEMGMIKKETAWVPGESGKAADIF